MEKENINNLIKQMQERLDGANEETGYAAEVQDSENETDYYVSRGDGFRIGRGICIINRENEYVRVTKINGKPIQPDVIRIEIDLPGWFDVEVDYDRYLSDHNLTESEEKDYVLAIPGEIKSVGNYDKSFYACAENSNTRVASIINVGELFTVPIQKIKELTGTVNFRFCVKDFMEDYVVDSVDYIDDYPHIFLTMARAEIRPNYGELEEITIAREAFKTKYLVGEMFDPKGIIIEGRMSKGHTWQGSYITVQNAGVSLKAYDTYVGIAYLNKTVKHSVQVIGQHLNVNIKSYWRKDLGDGWGNWSEYSVQNMYISKDDTVERKSVISFNKSAFNLGAKKITGLRLPVQITATDGQPVKHVKVNGIVHTVPESGEFYIYLGNVKTGETGTAYVTLEYVDSYLRMAIQDNPIVYYCAPLDPTIQSERKSFNLAGNVACSIDLLRGSETMAISDIDAESTLLGVGVSHVYNADDSSSYYGANLKLNLYERLELVDDFDGPIATPVYTDATGAKYTFTVLYYVTINGTDYYLNDEAKGNITGTNGNYTYQGYAVKHKYLKIGNNIFVTKILEKIKNAVIYTLLKGTSREPKYWIKSGVTYKGFDAKGRLSITIDAFNRYIEFTYDNLDRITKINDGNGNFINFTYNNDMRLSFITDSRGREIRYTYDDNGCLTTIAYFDENEDNYKTINLSYINLSTENVGSYVITEVKCSDTSRTLIDYEQTSNFEHRINSITHFAKMDLEEEKQISQIKFGYDYANFTTDITDNYKNSKKYVFGSDGSTKKYFQIINGKVAHAEYFDYVPFEKQSKTVISDKYLNKYYYDEFVSASVQSEIEDSAASDKPEITETILNEYNVPVKTTTKNIRVAENSYKQVTIEYTYDDEYKVTKEYTEEKYPDGSVNKFTTNYTYDDATKLLSVKIVVAYHGSVFEYEEFEVYTYDTNGCVSTVKNYRLNANEGYSYDPFYQEKEYDSNKLPIKEWDESGQYITYYTYNDKTKLVNGVISHAYELTDYYYDNEDRLSCVSAIAREGDNFANKNHTVYKNGEVQTAYSGDNVNKIEYTYDAKCRPITITLNGEVYESCEYLDNVRNRYGYYEEVTLTNANEEKFKTREYASGRRQELYIGDDLILEKDYNGKGLPETVTDNLTNHIIKFGYDASGNMTSYKEGENYKEGNLYAEDCLYNTKGQVTKVDYSGDVERKDTFTYKGAANDYVSVMNTGSFNITVKKDLSDRYTGKVVKISGVRTDEETVEYLKVGDHATHIPKKISYSDGTTLEYTYDHNGNITEIKKDGETVSRYKYDYLKRLAREDNNAANKSYFYKYDEHGNISEKRILSYTLAENPDMQSATVKSYEYDNKGRIKRTYWSMGDGDESEFMSEDNPATYDNMGNPLKWRSGAMTWTRGRKLVSYGNNTFEYDAMGRRTKKNNITFTYDSRGRLIKQSNGVEFFYDMTGLVGLTYKGKKYCYRKDIQGNIIAILDSTGKTVVKYNYDAWGKLTVNGDLELGYGINPFTYRGYYYDTETGLYYLQTRYYDPKIGRFINMDSIDYADPSYLNGLNLYAYCNNNPVMGYDPEGTFVSTILGAIFGAIWGGINAVFEGKDILTSVAHGAVVGALSGLAVDVGMAVTAVSGGTLGSIGATIAGLGVTAALGFGAGFAGDVAGQMLFDNKSWNEIDWGQASKVGAINSVVCIASFGVSYASGLNASSTGNLFKMLLPEYTPGWSWLVQGIFGFPLGFFPSIPDYYKLNHKKALR